MASKYIAALATLALAALAAEPLCTDIGSRHSSYYDFTYFKETDDSRIFAFCYEGGSGATIDNNWVTDIGAILQTMVDSPNACCVDCLPTAEAAGCTGVSRIWNLDNCNAIGDDPPALDQISMDIFMELIQDLANMGQQLPSLEDLTTYKPVLTIDLIENGNVVREQEFNIFGDGDTC